MKHHGEWSLPVVWAGHVHTGSSGILLASGGHWTATQSSSLPASLMTAMVIATIVLLHNLPVGMPSLPLENSVACVVHLKPPLLPCDQEDMESVTVSTYQIRHLRVRKLKCVISSNGLKVSTANISFYLFFSQMPNGL